MGLGGFEIGGCVAYGGRADSTNLLTLIEEEQLAQLAKITPMITPASSDEN